MSPEPAPITNTEPVASYTAIATVVALIAGAINIAVDPAALVEGALAVVAFAGYIIAAVKARSKVTPVA